MKLAILKILTLLVLFVSVTAYAEWDEDEVSTSQADSEEYITPTPYSTEDAGSNGGEPSDSLNDSNFSDADDF